MSNTRTPEEIRERIQLAIIEQINSYDFNTIIKEPENLVPILIKSLTDKITEITLDEITFRRRF